jgi:hypothetical protein
VNPVDLIAVVIAALALGLSSLQWFRSQQEAQLRMLSGEETAGFQAIRIARNPRASRSL